MDEEVLLNFHYTKMSYILSTCEFDELCQPTSNILLTPADYINYWTSMMNAAFKQRNRTLYLWDALKKWQCEVFGFYLESDALILFSPDNTLDNYKFNLPKHTTGYQLMMYTIDAKDSVGFHTTVHSIFKQNKERFIKCVGDTPNAGNILKVLASSYPNDFFGFAINTHNQVIIEITAPLVSKLVTYIPNTNFAKEALAQLVFCGFPITKIPHCKDESFQETLARKMYSSPTTTFGNIYNVSYLNINNISVFKNSRVLSEYINLFIAVHFERYKYALIFSCVYWLLLLMIPSLLTAIMTIFKTPATILIVFRCVSFLVYFLVFGVYYRFSVIVCIPVILNLCSLYCAALCVESVLLEIFFMCYNFYWYFTLIIYTSDKVNFLINVRSDGCFVFKVPDIKYILVAVNGTISVSSDNRNYIKILQIKNIPIHV